MEYLHIFYNFMRIQINGILKHYSVIKYFVNAELRSEASKYYMSYLWWVIEPLIDMIVYFVIFELVLGGGTKDYVPFLLIGILTYKWFGTAVSYSSKSILQRKNIIKESILPVKIFPIIEIVKNTFKFLIVFIVLCIFLRLYGFAINIHYLYLIGVIFCEFTLILCFSFLFALILPFFQDVEIAVQSFLRLLLFLSGVFFKADRFLPKNQFWFYLNPLANIIESYRNVLMYDTPPRAAIYLITAICIPTFCILLNFSDRFDRKYAKWISSRT